MHATTLAQRRRIRRWSNLILTVGPTSVQRNANAVPAFSEHQINYRMILVGAK